MRLAGLVFVRLGGHVLGALIALEAVVLVVFYSLSLFAASCQVSPAGIILLLTITAAGAALGLSLLVALCRRHGKDLVTAFNLA